MPKKFWPKATNRLIPPGPNDPPMRPIVVSFHVDAGNSPSLFRWFNGPSGGIESHLHIRKGAHKPEQYRQFTREADGQLGGNSWLARDGERVGAVIVETQGRANGGWTRRQKTLIKEFCLWAHTELGVPLRKVTAPNPKSADRGGFGYHSLFDEWNSMSKSCPGRKRIAWFNNVLVPWLEQRDATVVVGEGDTLPKIARRRGVKVWQLVRWNRWYKPKPGDRLRVKKP